MTTGQWTIRSIMDWSQNYLESKKIDTPRIDCEVLLSKALGCRRIDLYLNFDKPLTEEERSTFRDYLKRRADLEPVAYITGERGFFKYDFSVSEGVLIPRPDTEVVLEKAIDFINASQKESGKFLDIGTGSGCLSISLAKEFSGWQGEATDLSDKALEISEANKVRLEADNLQIYKHDIFSDQSLQSTEYDLIISNPPYISRDEIGVMGEDVLKFEPECALFAEQNGLAFYERISKLAKNLLREGGALVFEIGYLQGGSVKDILLAEGFSNVEVFRDYGGRDRGVLASR